LTFPGKCVYYSLLLIVPNKGAYMRISRNGIFVAVIGAAVLVLLLALGCAATARNDVEALVIGRTWKVSIGVESQQQFQERVWESECSGANCSINTNTFGSRDCSREDTGRRHTVTDFAKVTNEPDVCNMQDDLSTCRVETDYSTCEEVEDASTCEFVEDRSSCEFDENDEMVCDEIKQCDTETVCGTKSVCDQEKVCTDGGVSYGTSVTPVFENKCNVTQTRWVSDGQPYVTSGAFEAPFDPVILWQSHRNGARQLTPAREYHAMFKLPDGKNQPWDSNTGNWFDLSVWDKLKAEQSVTLVVNGFGSIVEIKFSEN